MNNMQKKVETLKGLEEQLLSEETVYKNSIKESEAMQSVLIDTTKNTKSVLVIQQLAKNLENLRNEESVQRVKVEKLREKILKRKSEVINKVVIKKPKIDTNK